MSDKGSRILIEHAQALHRSIATLLTKQARLLPADVHRLRVSVKELRALWQVMKPLMAKGQADAASRSIGRAGKLLADVRDRQVQLDILDACIGKAGAEERPSLRRAREQLIARSGDIREAIMTADIASVFAQDLERWQALELDCGMRKLVGVGYCRLYRKACKRFRRAAASGCAEDWHRLRRWTKYLALVTPLMAEDGRANAAAKRYSSVAGMLGDLHDLDLLTAGLRELPYQDREALAQMEKQRDVLQRKCCKKARRLFDSRASLKQSGPVL